MEYSIESRTLTRQPTGVRRATLAAGQVGSWLVDSYGRVAAYLERAGVPICGPPYAQYRFRDREMEVEAGFPVARARSPATARSWRRPRPGSCRGYDPPRSLRGPGDTHQAILTWMERHGCEPAGGHWEVYYSSPAEEPDSSRWRTDVVAPYTRKAA